MPRFYRKQDTLIIFILLLLQQSFSWLLFNKLHPKINRVVFSGGGAKGVLYPGAYQALDEAGLLQTITEVSGCSIGSVAAGFLSVGIRSDAFRQAILDANFNHLFGARAGLLLKVNPPGCFPISRTGLPFEQWVRKQLTTSVQRYFSATLITSDSNLFALKDKLTNNNQAEFTFSDLELLNKEAPILFKKLTVVATNYPEGSLALFNAQISPHVDIAKAIRASASLPILLIPAAVGDTQFMDGGLLDNIPDYFDLDKGCNNLQKTHTLLFTFKDAIYNKAATLFRALHGPASDEPGQGKRPLLFKPNLFEYFKLDYLAPWLLGLRTNSKMTQNIEQGYQRIRTDYPLRTVALTPGLLNTLDFRQAQKQSRVMWAFGYLDTMQFLLHHDLVKMILCQQRNLFYSLLNYFVLIYSSVLEGAEQNVSGDKLFHKVNCFLDKLSKDSSARPESCEELMHFIKERVEVEPFSVAAFALSRALEYYHHHINASQLTAEMEETTRGLIYQKRCTNIWNFFKPPVKQAKLSVEKINAALEDVERRFI